nr:hypothetical protein CFP56_65546 [Quercus suber]
MAQPLRTWHVYPFIDGNVEDFDLIFKQLEVVSSWHASIIYGPDAYVTLFIPVGKKLVQAPEPSCVRAMNRREYPCDLPRAIVYKFG